MKNLTPWGPHLYGWDSEPLEKSRKIYGRLRIPKAQRKAVLKPLWRTPALSSNQNLDETEKGPPPTPPPPHWSRYSVQETTCLSGGSRIG